MSWAGTASVVIGGVATWSSVEEKRKAASAQAALSKKAAAEMRARAVESSAATKSEIRNLKAVRAMDMPALRAAGEMALRKAAAGAERMHRIRTLGSTTGDVREQLFAGQFQSYIARESQRLGRYTQLTQQIIGATTRQQEIANDVEARAGGMEFQGQMEAIRMRSEAGSATAQILSAVGSAASAYARTQANEKRLAKARSEQLEDSRTQRGFMLEMAGRGPAGGSSRPSGTDDWDLGQWQAWAQGGQQ